MSITLPTPPSSPCASVATLPQERDTLAQLKTLQQYYASTSQWVTHTRAALFEIALAQGAEPSSSSSLPQPSLSSPQTPASPAASEAESADVEMRKEESALPASARTSTLLTRRKNGMKLELKLDGIGARRRYRRPAPTSSSAAAGGPTSIAKCKTAVAPSPAPAPAVVLPGDHIAHMLQLFGDLVDSRMESCARMERLIRGAAAPMPAW